MSVLHDRRSFLFGTVASLAGAATVAASAAPLAAQTAPAPSGAPQTPPAAAGARQWDLSWLGELKGKHRQVFDYGSYNLENDWVPLRFVAHYISAHKEVSGLEPADLGTAVGIMFSSFPINASDAIWEKYKLGEHWKITDPKTRQPAVRNIFLEDSPIAPGVKGMQARGTIFWQCNVALGRVVMTLAQLTGTSPGPLRADLVAGLNPGVRLVPAHVMAVGLAQELGMTYCKA